MSTISASTTSTTAYKVTADTTGTLVLQTGSSPTTAVTIDTSQNVGVGTTSPVGRVDAYGDGTNPSGVFRRGGAYGNIESSDAGRANRWTLGRDNASTGNFVIAYNDSTKASIDSSGNLGIGTTSPSAPLDVSVNQNLTTTLRVANTNAGSSAQTRLLLISDGGNIQVKATSTTNTTYGVGDVGVINCDNMSGGLRFSHNDSVGMVYDSNANLLMGATTLASGLGADRAFQLTANSYIFGNSQSNGVVTFTKSIPDNTATTFLTVANIDNWAGTILISYVRNADQNRSGMKMVRYAYSRTFTSLLDSSQNSGATFSVSGNNLQVTIGGAGTYLCQFTIWGGSV